MATSQVHPFHDGCTLSVNHFFYNIATGIPSRGKIAKHCFYLLIKFKILITPHARLTKRAKKSAGFVNAGGDNNCLQFFHWRVSHLKYAKNSFKSNGSNITKICTWTRSLKASKYRRKRHYIEFLRFGNLWFVLSFVQNQKLVLNYRKKQFS